MKSRIVIITTVTFLLLGAFLRPRLFDLRETEPCRARQPSTVANKKQAGQHATESEGKGNSPRRAAGSTAAAGPIVKIAEPPNRLHQPVVEDPVMEERRREFRARMATKEAARLARKEAFYAALSPEDKARIPEDAEFYDIINGVPRFIGPNNVEAGICSNASLLRSAAYGNLTGAGIHIGVWEAELKNNTSAAAASGHDDWGTRVSHGGDFTNQGASDHAWGVLGTLLGDGSSWSGSTLGMAPGATATLWSRPNVLDELAGQAATSPSSLAAGKIALSNHSYATLAGWSYRWNDVTWWGPPGFKEDPLFGQYTERSADWDELSLLFPYHLPFVSAGNDRSDGRVAEGDKFFRHNSYIILRDPDSGDPVVSGQGWSRHYWGDSPLDPWGDGVQAARGDFENPFYFDLVVGGPQTAKNTLTVGSVDDYLVERLTSGKVRVPSDAVSSFFSSIGPTDDGRVKPDLVAVGNDIFTTAMFGGSTAAGAVTLGTSFSSPVACGTVALVLEHYRREFPGQLPPAALLKGLLCHTADDLAASHGFPGPDYIFGWGAIDGAAAAELITKHNSSPINHRLFTSTIANGTTHSFALHWDEEEPIRITLCYQDPPGEPKVALNDRTPVLVNDLDLTLTGPGGRVWHPYKLDPDYPVAATTGDNDVDNVEQIYVSDPVPGTYLLEINIDGTLTGGSQDYALVRSGLLTQAPVPVPQVVTSSSPYQKDFATGLPLASAGWSSSSSGTGRITPLTGGLVLHTASAGYSLNTLTLHTDLSAFQSSSPLTLEIDWRDINDESHTLPATHDGSGQGDGVSISTDGVTWHRLGNLHSSSTGSTLESLKIDLDTLVPSLGLNYTGVVRFRISQYDDQPLLGDGIRIEQVRLYERSVGSFEMAYRQLEEDRGNGSAVVRVNRRLGTQGAASVSYFTRPVTAVAGVDYLHKTGTLNFADGQANASFVVDFGSGESGNGPRVFEVVLGGSSGAGLNQNAKITTVVIVDDNEPSVIQTDPEILRPVCLYGKESATAQSLRVWNRSGYGAIDFEIESDTPWIEVSNGTRRGDAITPAVFDLRYNFASLAAGRYLGSVTVRQLTAPLSEVEIPVVLDLGYHGTDGVVETSPATNDIPVDGPIPFRGPALFYPSQIASFNAPGRISNVVFGFDGLNHTQPADLDIVLEAPDGRSVMLLSDSLASASGNAVTISGPVDDSGRGARGFVSGNAFSDLFRPTNAGVDTDLMPSPCPQTPGRFLADLKGSQPNGLWNLYINDDSEGGHGNLAGAWLAYSTVVLDDGMYETVKSNTAFGLGGQSLLFTPADNASGYVAGRSELGGLPLYDPGPSLSVPTNGTVTVNLSGGAVIPFYGQNHGSFRISEDGMILFGETPLPGATGFFSLPAIAALSADLTLASGSIHFTQLSDRAVVSWLKLVESSSGSQVSFRIELFFDGRIRILWDPSDPVDGLVGLSRGYGEQANAISMDFSALSEPILVIRGYDFEPNGDCTISWSSQPGIDYVLEWSQNLTQWHTLQTVAGASGEATIRVFTDPSDGTKLFVRVRKNATIQN